MQLHRMLCTGVFFKKEGAIQVWAGVATFSQTLGSLLGTPRLAKLTKIIDKQ
jgi:hypothetical protein